MRAIAAGTRRLSAGVRPTHGYRYSQLMRPLRYSINVTLDGCCDHRAMLPYEDLHRHAVENLDRADALLFGRGTYEMMEAEFRPPVQAQAGKGLFTGGVKLPLALPELGLIDEYEFVVQPRLAGHGPTLFSGLSKHLDLKLV
jgi:dihydrofolate reductase